MTLPFTKMHGAGNDFVVIDATRRPFRPDPSLLQRLTDRRFGVGCDQILVVDPPPAPDVDFGYRIYNADGSESGQCGNGARCLARFVADRGLSERRRLRVRTATATLGLQLLDDGRVEVDMGTPRFEPAAIPLGRPERAVRYEIEMPEHGRVMFGAVSMGNPHAVIAVAETDQAPVESLGRALQADRTLFPDSVNVGFLQIVDRKTARLRVYERGAGETLACGSGACAAFAVARLWNQVDARASLLLRGGTLELAWAGGETAVLMTGPAETVYEGSLPWTM